MAISGLGLMPTATHTVTRQILTSELVEIGKLKGVYEELFLLLAKRKIPNPIAVKIHQSFTV